MTMAPTCCSVRVVMNGTCAAAFAEDGPTCWNCPFRAVAASLPPEAAVSKYGLLICLGRKAIVSEPLVALGVLPADELLRPECAGRCWVPAQRGSTIIQLQDSGYHR